MITKRSHVLKQTCSFITLSLNIGLKMFNPLSDNPTKWSNTLKQFLGLALKGLNRKSPVNGLCVYLQDTFN